MTVKINKTTYPMDKDARRTRYQNYLQLKSLPFLNEDQAKELLKLSRQIKIDSHYAHQEDMSARFILTKST